MKLRSFRKNMTEIEKDDLTVLFSYETPVACHIAGKGFFRTEKSWSKTTTRHINEWMQHHGGSGKAETKPQSYFDALV